MSSSPPRSESLRRPFLALAGLVVVAAVVPLLFLAGGGDEDVDTPRRGDPAPRFEAMEPYGGRPLVLHFCGSWNPQCEDELEVLVPALEEFDQDALTVLVGDDTASAAAFHRRLGATWPLVDDPDGAVAAAYGVDAVPQTFFVDAGGVVTAHSAGLLTPEILEARLEELVTPPSGS